MSIKLFASYFYLIAMFIGQLIITRAITQNLGIELYGVWAILISIQTYLFAVDSGFSASVTTYANIFIEKKDKKSVRNLISTNIGILTLIFLSLFLVFLLYIGFDKFFFISSSDQIYDEWNISIFIVLINVYLMSIVGIFSNYLIAIYRIEISKLFQIFHVMLYSFLVYLAAENGADIESLLVLVLLSSAIYLFFIFFYIKAKNDNELPKSFFYIDRDLYKKISKFIYNTFILAIASRIQFYTDVLVIGLLIGFGSAGLFEINNKIPFYSTYIFTAFVAIYYPLFTQKFHSNNLLDLEMLFLTVQKYSILLSIGLAASLILYGEKFITIWVGSDMLIGTNIFLLMILSMIFHAIFGPVAVVLQAIGKNSKLMKYEVFAALINIISSIVLIVPFGLIGVIYGTIFSQLFVLIFVYQHLLKLLKISVFNFYREVLLPTVIHLSVIASIFYFSRVFWFNQNTLLEIICGSIFIMIITIVTYIAIEKILVLFRISSYNSIKILIFSHKISSNYEVKSNFEETKFIDPNYKYIKFLRKILVRFKFLRKPLHLIKKKYSKFAWRHFSFLWPYEKSQTMDELIQNEIKNFETLFIIDSLKTIYNFTNLSNKKNIIELGCNKGQKLIAISNSLPNFKYIGYDINNSFISIGNNFIKSKEDSKNHIQLQNKDITKLKFEIDSDVVFTALTLMYIDEKVIKKIINNIAKFSRDAFIIQELIDYKNYEKIIGYDHNYEEIFTDLGINKIFDIDFDYKDIEASSNSSSRMVQIFAKRKNLSYS
jgi:O-antigen/teichoic acid export membrane protein